MMHRDHVEEALRLVNGDGGDVAAAQVHATLAVAQQLEALVLHFAYPARVIVPPVSTEGVDASSDGLIWNVTAESSTYHPACGQAVPHAPHNGFARADDSNGEPWCKGLSFPDAQPVWKP